MSHLHVSIGACVDQKSDLMMLLSFHFPDLTTPANFIIVTYGDFNPFNT